MGENRLSSLAVLLLVARLAERNSVRHVESQFGVVGEGLDVMGVKIPAASIAAPLAGKVVTAEHVEAPSLVFSREANTTALCGFAILVVGARWTRQGSIASDNADLLARLDGVGDSQSLGWLASFGVRHLLLGIVRVMHPLERGHSAAQGGERIFGRTAGLADSDESVSAALVDMEAVTFNPAAARIAPLKALLNSLLVFLNGYADSFCSSLRCACFASHTNS